MALLVLVAKVLYLFAPLLFAAVLSAIVIKNDLMPFARRPIDGGLHLGGAQLFGATKTWRGVIVAVFGGAIFASAQQHIDAGDLAIVNYRSMNAALFGGAMGLGAMLGELPNSFVKRRLGIKSGGTARGPLSVLFYVWDQVDLLIGAWPLIAIWVRPEPEIVVTSFVLALVVHPTVSLIGWWIGARKTAR